MTIKVFIERYNETKVIEKNIKDINSLLKELSINPETVVTARNNELATTDAKLKDGDEVRILSVISGG
ncbi:MoaD/ThiS family protein [Candidatus Woesearchaeota archaeon]|nr:MoaD/ThiS family protein [Candidatus Woesearchaeota archaeon]